VKSSRVSGFARDEPLDLEELRARLRKMPDAALLRFGTAARNMCTPHANYGHPPRENFVVHLREAREERKRRKELGNRTVRRMTRVLNTLLYDA
jgi:hypothetical protein